ncbi:uncharacterized protein SAMN02745196_02039 [Clostridium collagenovorans DSM 3089]|uniref:Radical SAM core domain-containing protein n=1 Tax=Clostridium collagenovorans DSM 3089 TaxID=1121306 RepID=A0A1M5X6S4_9CLOT|nr:radical SAM protein [Clostridium collagenovorans]SHH95278.1 uncharacterized protein SAMN02745196_02039 [Clostridium collagenovorans DSM 3089]
MKYKHSHYNIEFKVDDKKYIYNPYKGIFKLKDELYYAYNNLENASDKEKKILLDKKLIVDSKISEYGRVKLIRDISRLNEKQLFLSIAPTFSCNFLCEYCFVKKSNMLMNEDVEKEIVDFVEKRLKEGLKILRITWLGGEPLLNMESIKRLSIKFITLCDKYECDYSAFIITNGSLLTTEYIKIFKTLNINGIQITIDGSEVSHNLLRPMKKENSYKKIMKNLLSIEDLKFNLRINISKENLEDVNELIKYISNTNIKGKILDTHISPIYSTDYMNEETREKCLNNYEFAKMEINLIKEILVSGIAKKFDLLPMIVGSSKEVFWSFSIDPEGNVYKDEYYLGNKEYRIGKLKDISVNHMTNNRIAMECLNNNPIDNSKCEKCNVLPLCMGGNIQHFYESTHNSCSSIRYNIEEKLKLYVDRMDI